MTTQKHPQSSIISDVTAWILRIGVAVSASVMLLGIILSYVHGNTSVERMQSDRFDYHPSHILDGIVHGHGKSVIELGVYLLVLTPIMRVFCSLILFALAERDKKYTVITLVTLILTLAGLLWVG